MREQTIEEQIKAMDALIADAQAVLARFPFQTNIRQNISTLKDRRRELMKQLQAQTTVA